NPVRTGAQTSWSGTYTVTVQPEHCGTPIIQDVTVTVNPLPAAPAVTNATLNYCRNVTATSLLSETGATATQGNTLRWYSSDGTTIITPPSSINTSATGSTTYYVSQVNDITGCESVKVTVTVNIHAVPDIPTSASTSPASMCPNTTFSIIVSPTPASDTYYKVYSASANGTLLGQSSSGSGTISNLTAPSIGTTYYVATVNSSDCESTTRKSVIITINNAATKNNINISGTTEICYGVNTTLTASLSGITVTSPFYRWYSSQTETTPFHTGSSYTTSNLTADNTFYVSVSGNNYCENAYNNRKEVRVTVYDTLVAGFISHTTTNYCYKVSTLEIKLENVPLSGGSNRYSYQWQSSTDGIQWSDIVGISTLDYSISGLDQTTYYRRAVVDSVCGTVYSDIDTVYRVRSIQPFQTDICTGLTVHISPSTNGLWKSSDPSIMEVVNNNSIVGINPGEAKLTFYDSLAGNCDTIIDIKVYAYPNPNEITGSAKVVCIGETIELTNTTPGGDWTKNNDNISFDNPQANPVKVTGKTEGNSFVTYTVSDGVCQTKRTFRVQVISNLPPPKIIIGIER
ncbi:MAG: hypothetical protein LBG80_19415, partial [Bacteroidales bacterium]|nr:hypothetical protein [Bacteroidales bacterium]